MKLTSSLLNSIKIRRLSRPQRSQLLSHTKLSQNLRNLQGGQHRLRYIHVQGSYQNNMCINLLTLQANCGAHTSQQSSLLLPTMNMIWFLPTAGLQPRLQLYLNNSYIEEHIWLSNSAITLFKFNLPVFCYLVHYKKRNIAFYNVVVLLYLLLFGLPCKSWMKKVLREKEDEQVV